MNNSHVSFACRLLFSLFLIGSTGLPVRAVPPRYAVIQVGDFGYQVESVTSGVNDAGQVVGHGIETINDGDDTYTFAFCYDRGSISYLGGLGTSGESNALAINASGQIAGYAVVDMHQGNYHAMLYTNGVLTDLGTLPGPTYLSSYANAINRSGQVVGSSDTGNDSGSHAFLYSGGVMTDLGGTGSAAYAINDLGQIAGVSNDQAFFYSAGTMTDLGTFGGQLSGAYGINDRGQVVGVAELKESGAHAFLYANGRMHDLGTLGGPSSLATGINTSGEIVGYSEVKKSTYTRAFLDIDGKMTDLNDLIPSSSKWVILSANAISDHGLIAATGTVKGSVLQQALLLAPVPMVSILGGSSRVTHHPRLIVHGKASPTIVSVTYTQHPRKIRPATGVAKWHIAVKLQPGKNVITIIAHDVVGQTVSRKITITRS